MREKEHIEKQWNEWQEKNPPSSRPYVNEERLKKLLVDDLSFVCKMDVKEYTLYQKWCEIHEKYPLSESTDLWGDVGLKNPDQDMKIRRIKNNIWIPENPDDYSKLEPVMVYTNESSENSSQRIFGEDSSEEWNTIRVFTSTMKNNANIGRNLYFIVKDNITGKYLGVIDISSDFLDLTPRDKAIGWSRELKTQGGMINYTAIGSTIVPLQPLGYNYMGGKLLALLCLSDDVQRIWKEKYGNVLVGVTTTSLYGKTKVGGLSQYDGLEHWQPMGFSSGSVAFEPSKQTMRLVWTWLKGVHTRKYFEWWEAKNKQGLPYKRDHKNRSLNFAYSKLGIPKNLVRSEHQRGIYFSPLYNNTYDFLCGKIKEKDLVKSFDTSTETLANIWKNKYAKGRISMLKKKGTVSTDTLFYDDLIYMDWEETKKKYLTQVGR